jgi:glycosyltransferase involved in cell wall biosynthesis
LNPKVSIVIPTKNSAKTIESCILSAKYQTFSENEIIIVDSNSTDSTINLATQLQCKVISTEQSLLGARYEGFRAAQGDYILMLDSDQVLERDAVERSILFLQSYDMLCLEETPYETRTIVQKMFAADRRLVHRETHIQMDPVNGTLLPRFYKRNILQGAFNSIPASLYSFVILHDHSIIYYEAWKLTNRVAIVPKAVRHNEIATLKELWAKNFRYGKSVKRLLVEGSYNDLIKHKTYNFRRTKSKMSSDKLLSLTLLLLKAPPYLTGYLVGTLFRT